MTTHELGHNFGAEHDPDNVEYCAPREDQGGKYVMYPIAVSGDHVNNKVTGAGTGPEPPGAGPGPGLGQTRRDLDWAGPVGMKYSRNTERLLTCF